METALIFLILFLCSKWFCKPGLCKNPSNTTVVPVASCELSLHTAQREILHLCHMMCATSIKLWHEIVWLPSWTVTFRVSLTVVHTASTGRSIKFIQGMCSAQYRSSLSHVKKNSQPERSPIDWRSPIDSKIHKWCASPSIHSVHSSTSPSPFRFANVLVAGWISAMIYEDLLSSK